MKYITTINDRRFEIEVRNDGTVWVNGEQRDVDFLPLTESLFSIISRPTEHRVRDRNPRPIESGMRWARRAAPVANCRAAPATRP